MSISQLLAAKAATDAGFDRELAPQNGWTCHGVSGRALKVYIATENDMLRVAVSSPAIRAELGSAEEIGAAIPGTQAAWYAANPAELFRLLRRIRMLDATLPNQLHQQFQSVIEAVSGTERDAIVRQRVGQDLFRKGLMDYWDGRCAISGLAVPELLRASHAKPWRDANDEERLDVHNGLLLAAHLDAAFDAGLITVLVGGEVRCAASLSEASRKVLGLEGDVRIDGLKAGHVSYLAWHAEKVFQN